MFALTRQHHVRVPAHACMQKMILSSLKRDRMFKHIFRILNQDHYYYKFSLRLLIITLVKAGCFDNKTRWVSTNPDFRQNAFCLLKLLAYALNSTTCVTYCLRFVFVKSTYRSTEEEAEGRRASIFSGLHSTWSHVLSDSARIGT